MQMAKLVGYKTHDLVIEWYMREYARDPMPGFNRVTLEQIRRVDEEIFVRLAEEMRAGLAPDPVTGDLPLEPLIPLVMVEPRITLMLAPTQAGRATS